MITFNNLEEIKAYAKKQLEKTDYSVLPDINLKNKDEFVFYRNLLRIVYFNPQMSSQFPQEPLPIWGEPVSTLTAVVQPKTDIPTV
jgi:hypothetical protein